LFNKLAENIFDYKLGTIEPKITKSEEQLATLNSKFTGSYKNSVNKITFFKLYS